MEIDWAYFRKGWQSCEKARKFFEQNNIPINMVVSPGKDPITEDEAIVLINSFKKIFVAKGKRVVEYKTMHDDKKEVIKAALGRTGNLRSPAVHFEDTIFIGYNSQIYQHFGQWCKGDLYEQDKGTLILSFQDYRLAMVPWWKMDKEIKNKIDSLINKTRVMTIAVSDNGIPWSAPVYFVAHNKKFYFFSNENARHIKYTKDQNILSASIFHDSDQMDLIFGFQMSGVLEEISHNFLYLTIVKKYVAKFNFLMQVFGREIIENKHFFSEKFKSHLYCFYPKIIFLSDNSKTTDKRTKINLNNLPD